MLSPLAALCSLGRAGHREGVLLTWVSFLGGECWGQAVLVAKMSSSKPEPSISPGSADGSWGTATPEGLSGLCSPQQRAQVRGLHSVLAIGTWCRLPEGLKPTACLGQWVFVRL